MNTEGYTPKRIVGDNLLFEIPLYQRLFQWQDVQIKQLMNDLYSEYSMAKELSCPPNDQTVARGCKVVNNRPYYIGMLTSKKNSNGRFDLIDGQQRMTVLMLMGIVFQWNSFLSIDGQELRLSFFARPRDMEYLESKISGTDCHYENINMKAGIESIESFIEEKKMSLNEKQAFGNYIYENLTLFIYGLPDEYDQADLNRYFESMNSTGKSLENHEILKVELLKRLSGSKDQYTRIWNAVAEMDKPLLRQRTWKVAGKIESKEDFQQRCKNAIRQALKNAPSAFFEKSQECLINDFNKDEPDTENNKESLSIKAIPASSTQPTKLRFSRDNRSILSFPEFLLEVLYLTLFNDIGKYLITDFFNIHKLQDTFEHFKGKFEIETFINNLLIYRILLDVYCIKINNDESGYSLDDFIDSKSGESVDGYKQMVIQYQSMLYVSSNTLSYYSWVVPLLQQIQQEIRNDNWVDARTMLKMLKDIDNKRPKHDLGSLNPNALIYKTVDRYWFWRLDYYLWENREKHFTAKAREIAANYVFRTNRSIEHIAPQTPRQDSNLKWDENLESDRICRDCFGNLAMISSSQNSSLRNESYEIKHAYIQSFINQSKVGSVESLKLLKIFDDCEVWDRGTIKTHGEAMFTILQESYLEQY